MADLPLHDSLEVARFKAALLAIDRVAVKRIVADSLAGSSPQQVVDRLVCPALEQIGGEWASGHAALSQVYMSARLCEELVGQALPPPMSAEHAPRVAVAVLEDGHALGKRIVRDMLHAAGYPTLDYGLNAMVDDVARKAASDHLDALLISTLMLRSALRVSELTDRLRQAGQAVRVYVGGAPFIFDTALWQEVGADGTGRSAADAIQMVANLSART